MPTPHAFIKHTLRISALFFHLYFDILLLIFFLRTDRDPPSSCLFPPPNSESLAIPPINLLFTVGDLPGGKGGPAGPPPPWGLNRSLPDIPPFPPLALLYTLRRSLLPPRLAFPGFFSGVGSSHLKLIIETPGCRVMVCPPPPPSTPTGDTEPPLPRPHPRRTERIQGGASGCLVKLSSRPSRGYRSLCPCKRWRPFRLCTPGPLTACHPSIPFSCFVIPIFSMISIPRRWLFFTPTVRCRGRVFKRK